VAVERVVKLIPAAESGQMQRACRRRVRHRDLGESLRWHHDRNETGRDTNSGGGGGSGALAGGSGRGSGRGGLGASGGGDRGLGGRSHSSIATGLQFGMKQSKQDEICTK